MSKAVDTVKASRVEIVEEVIELIEKGGLKWMEAFARCFGQKNGISGRGYKGGNAFRLAWAASKRGYSDTRWCTFKQAKDKGWSVKKGAKGVLVEHWKNCVIKDEEAEGEEESIKAFPRLVGYWRVFNFEDIDGDIPEDADLPSLEADEVTACADRLIGSSRCPVREKETGTACYIPSADAIEIPLRDAFKTSQHFARVLLHEMTHSTGHPSALDRPSSGRFGTDGYAFEELVAELGSMFAAAELGIDFDDVLDEHRRQHAAYLDSWLANFRGDPDYLFKAAAKASAAADYIIERYEGEAAAIHAAA